MFEFIVKLFGGRAVDYRGLLKEGGKIVDVRSPIEYKSGHIKGSINIPLEKLSSNLGRLDKAKPVITCCASGMRSGTARRLLLEKGFQRVFNGGGWTNLQRKIT